MPEEILTKTCKVCKTQKPSNHFYINRRKGRNPFYRSMCKDCMVNKNKSYRKTEKGRLIIERSNRKYILTQNGKITQRRRTVSYRLNHPERYRAHSAINNAVRDGKIIRPTKCESCGNSGKIQSHHHLGYKKEHHYHVQWLCIPCHKAADS